MTRADADRLAARASLGDEVTCSIDFPHEDAATAGRFLDNAMIGDRSGTRSAGSMRLASCDWRRNAGTKMNLAVRPRLGPRVELKPDKPRR